MRGAVAACCCCGRRVDGALRTFFRNRGDAFAAFAAAAAEDDDDNDPAAPARDRAISGNRTARVDEDDVGVVVDTTPLRWFVMRTVGALWPCRLSCFCRGGGCSVNFGRSADIKSAMLCGRAGPAVDLQSDRHVHGGFTMQKSLAVK